MSFYHCDILNLRAYNIIFKVFLAPLLSVPTDTYYYNSKTAKVSKTFDQQAINHMYILTIPKLDKSNFDKDVAIAPWAVAFGGVRRCMRWLKQPKDMVERYFAWVGVPSEPFTKLLTYPLNIVLPLFKKIKIFCHTHYDQIGSALRYYVDLDALSGVPPTNVRSLGDDPVAWLTTDVPSDFTPEWWFRQFKSTFGQFAVYNPIRLRSIEQFALDRWLWVTDGASRFSKLTLEDEVVKTKFGAAVSLSDEEILNHVRNAIAGKDEEMIKVFVKPDEASFKRRLIANVPLGGYIIAAYVRYLIQSYLGKEPQFEKLNVSISDSIKVIDLLREGKVCYPLDESAYDYHVTRESWVGFLTFLKYIFPDNSGVDCFIRYFDIATWDFAGQKGKWYKGMPSGLALTTLLNSWMNYIKQTNVVPGYINWACGDDVLSFVDIQNFKTLDTIEKEYNKFGSAANAAKNWVSTKFGEYLKVLYGRYGTTGYPSRIFGSLMFSVTASPSEPNAKLYELTDLWKQFFDRMGLPMDENIVARDLTLAVSKKVPNFDKHKAKLWLHAPKIHGGFGKLPYNDFTFTWDLGPTAFTYYKGSKIRLPKVVKHVGPVQLKIGKYKLKSSGFKFGHQALLPKIETLEEWERRLNREDLPDRGPFTGMVLDLIPLPVIDFVSVSNMSKYASSNLFYCYPNLTGSWNSIASRLINGSIILAKSILTFLHDHQLQTFI